MLSRDLTVCCLVLAWWVGLVSEVEIKKKKKKKKKWKLVRFCLLLIPVVGYIAHTYSLSVNPFDVLFFF